MRILNSEPSGYSKKAYDLLEDVGEVTNHECDRTQLLSLIPAFDVLIVRLGNMIDREVLVKADSLKVIISATTGLNHIDLDAAEELGIAVLSLRGERAFLNSLTATAELTWGLLLSLLRKIPSASEHVSRGGWDRDSFKGNQLSGKTLGVIGYGRLGAMVADYGNTFQMKVLASDPFKNSFPSYVRPVGLNDLLAQSDVISLHVNHNESTNNLLNKSRFKKLKKGAVLINTSRGELIDEQAMLESLDSGLLAGVGLDVLDCEAERVPGWPRNNEVWKRLSAHSNIIITPHIGGATYESMDDAEVFMAQKLKNFFMNDMRATGAKS